VLLSLWWLACSDNRLGLEDGERKFIAKLGASNDLYSVVKAEFMAMRLAREVGLDVAPVHLRRADLPSRALICKEAALNKVDQALFWRRQFLNPFAFINAPDGVCVPFSGRHTGDR
jgi:hypothetical protein